MACRPPDGRLPAELVIRTTNASIPRPRPRKEYPCTLITARSDVACRVPYRSKPGGQVGEKFGARRIGARPDGPDCECGRVECESLDVQGLLGIITLVFVVVVEAQSPGRGR